MIVKDFRERERDEETGAKFFHGSYSVTGVGFLDSNNNMPIQACQRYSYI